MQTYFPNRAALALMRITHALLAALTLLVSGCTASRHVAHPDVNGDGFIVAGYHPWWLKDDWRHQDLRPLDAVFFFEVTLDSTGGIATRNGWPDRWIDMQQALHDRGIDVVPTVTLFDDDAFRQIFSDPARTDTLRHTLLGLLLDSPRVSGLQLDVEVFSNVSPAVREAFTRFMGMLRRDVDRLGRPVALSLFAPAFDTRDVFDEGAVAAYVDYFVVQGYDLHGRLDEEAGPVAGLAGWGKHNWEYVIDRYLSLGVPRAKIVMSVPYFGYEWPTESAEPGAATRGPGQSTTFARVDTTLLPFDRIVATERARQYGTRRDPVSGSPYYAFSDSSGWHQGWYEDPESLRAKYEYVRKEGLGGVAVFPLGYGDERLDAVLQEVFGGR